MDDVTKTSKGIYRRQEILEKAIQLFSEKGFTTTTMRMLAGEVGIKAASVYNHFPSKEAIVDEIVDSGNRSPDMVKNYYENLTGYTPKDRLRETITYWLKLGEENEDIVIIFLREPGLLSPERSRQFADATNELIAFFEERIQDGIRQGIFQVENPGLVAFNIWGLQLTWICRRGLLDPDYALDDYAARQAELIIRQICAA